ncbi:MAG: bifunctional phosphopantothenoylcysteine decarboxylase/phosphopantothenate--cysteine ligase CoaBC [Candidatus Aminicenantes bacterium]|nr:bifunctional phosphopantothenoylcysteine decarboxylase/phosphopantothenate--cysteine ligase CoaBC [Candidatus Aminicenantes bacterium]
MTRTVAVGICSSISIYKACEIIRLFQKRGMDVFALLTKNAARMISPLLFTALTGHRVHVDPFEEEPSDRIDHVALAREIDLFAIAPATANMIAKLASGVADDFVSTFSLVVSCPVLVAPAMNEAMFLHPQTLRNIITLKERGIRFVEPEKGYLACRDEGWGRLADPETIVREGLSLIGKSCSLQGKTVLVTAGPTREPMDPVRFLSNPSSGKMGYAMAGEAVRRGADVVLVSGPTHLYPPPKTRVVPVGTAAEMENAVRKEADEADIVIMAAAVSDYTFQAPAKHKLKKTGNKQTVELIPTADILEFLGRNKGGRFLVGFAAETREIEQNAQKKLYTKNLDMIVANDVGHTGIGFEADQNSVLILTPDGRIDRPGQSSKAEISRVIWDKIEDCLGQQKK